MEIKRFEECNVTFAKDQPEYQPLPAHVAKDGTVTSCWKLNDDELKQILMTGEIFLQVLTFGRPLQPVLLLTEKPNLEK